MNQHTKNLHVIKASAGAGKTFTLAKEYIEQLLWGGDGNLRPLHSCYHQHILAITFTNKATAEMKERIIVRLYELSQGTCGAYEQSFLAAHPSTSPQQLKEAAKAALEDILFDYTAFNVSTIDSFFQTVLRTFVYELDREYDYDLQLDEKYAMLQAVGGLMQSVGDGRNTGFLAKWVENYVSEQVRNQHDWNFFGNKMVADLADFAKVLGNEHFMKHHEEIRDYLKDVGDGGKSRLAKFQSALASVRAKREADAAGFYVHVADLLGEMGITADQLNKRYPLFKLMNVSDVASMSDSNLKTLAAYADDVKKLQGAFKKGALTDALMEQYLPRLQSMLKQYLAWIETMNVAQSIVSNLWQLGLLGKIDEYLEQFRKDNNQILISDTADLIAKVLEGGVPFLYERMGVWLNHFMIDEFQDTSRKQYDNFKPLLENSLSTGHYNLIIGDEKQSIYRFRNSDPDLFQTALPTEFRAYYDDSVDLHINRRSARLVIAFNNEFFKLVLDYYKSNHNSFEKLQKTYSKLHQDYPVNPDKEKEDARAKGFVKLNLVYGAPNSKNKSSFPVYTDKSTGEKYYGKSGVLKLLPYYILDQHERLGFPFGKILVLVNQNKEGVDVVNAILDYNQQHPDRLVNIVSAESLLLQNSAAVRMIVSVLYFINSSQCVPDDEDGEEEADGSLSAAQSVEKQRLRVQFFYKVLHDFGHALGEKGIDADPGQLLTDVFRDNDAFRAKPEKEQMAIFAEQLKTLLPNSQSEQASLSGVVDKIIKEFLEPIGLNKGAETSFLLAFQGVVLDFCSQRSSGGTIYEFLKYWEAKKDKLAIDSGQNEDAVEVMTIHKAKGLERACVIVPFADWQMERMDELCWVPRANWLSPDGSDSSVAAPFMNVPSSEADADIVPPLIPIPGRLLAKLAPLASFSSPLLEECVIDSLNKSYVAFTRPRQALHIFSSTLSESFNGESCTYINEQLLTIFPKIEGCKTVKSEDEDTKGLVSYYCIGEEEMYEEPSASPDDVVIEQEMMPDYTVRPALDRLRVKLPELVTESQESGNRLHRIMSRIRTKKNVDKAIEYAVKRRIIGDEGEWSVSRTKAFLHRLTTDPQTAPWYAEGNRVYNERAIHIPATESSPARHLRPDRIVRTPDGRALVIDYKFGDAPSEKQQKAYIRQVKTYCGILSKMWNMHVEGYLLHAKSFTVYQVV